MRACAATVWLALALVYLAPTQARGVLVDSTYVWGHWKLSESPYLVAGPIVLPEGSQLIIAPGVEVKFMDTACGFTVNGTLLAAGTPVDSILFSSASPKNFDWNGMTFNENAGGSDLKHCIIEHVATQAGLGGGVRIYRSSPSLRGCTVRHCTAGSDGGGIYLLDSASVITDCRFARNEADSDGGAIMIEGESFVRIEGCTITENNAGSGGGIAVFRAVSAIEGCSVVANESYGYGGGIYAQGATLTVTDSRCNGNSIFLSGGAGIWVQGGSATIRDTDISENSTAWGFAPGLGGQFVEPLVLEHVSICWNRDNDAGTVGGVFVDQSVLSLDHVTVFHNISADAGGLVAESASTVTLENSLFAMNGGLPEVLIGWWSVADISYCDIAGGPDHVGGMVNWLEGNIFEDPELCDPHPLLQSCSPCVGAGSGGSTIGCAGVGCPCDNPTSVDGEATETSWTRIKSLHR
jgi:predicted outer membrane repeat protein